MVYAILIASVLLLGVFLVFPRERRVEVMAFERGPEAPYFIFLPEPKNEYERIFFVSASALSVSTGKYCPIFMFDDNGLDSHQISTIRNMSEIKKGIVFSNNDDLAEALIKQLGMNLTLYPLSFDVIKRFGENNGTITVSSYKEALWASPIAAIKNMRIVYGATTYKCQEDAWEELHSMGVNATYVVVTNPMDYMPRVSWKNYTCAEDIANGTFDKWHIPSISLVAAELAAYHKAYVLTDIVPRAEKIGDLDADRNSYAIGIYLALRNVSKVYGPISYVCLVGSGSAIPQFILPDHADEEGKATVASDVIYGFLDNDPYTMDAAVGRIINYNAQGAVNMVARTLGYEYIGENVTVRYSTGEVKSVCWKTHGSSWNGYHVVDIRRQFSPGYFITRDFEDEGYTFEYVTTRGIARDRNEFDVEWEFEPILQSSGFVAYRGHGSTKGSFYMWGHNLPINKDTYLSAEDARKLYLPPQIFVSICCLNGYIWGKEFSGGDEINRTFSISYLYAGCIGLFASTEVSYSNLGQDKYALIGEVTGDHHWDKNDAIYAFIVDGLLDHEEEYGELGKALMWCVNRYIKNHGGNISPLYDDGDPVDWKETAIFALYGDPKFKFWQPRPGPNNYDPWHNGSDDY